MTAAFGGVVSAAPPTIGVSIRKATLTYENIIRSKEFTISIPSENYLKEADYFGIVSGRNNAKFLETGLTAIKGTYVDAPYVDEFPVNLECKLIKINELGLHTQFIGEIVEAKISEEVLDEEGNSDINKMKPISCLGSENSYYGLGNNLGRAFALGKEIKSISMFSSSWWAQSKWWEVPSSSEICRLSYSIPPSLQHRSSNSHRFGATFCPPSPPPNRSLKYWMPKKRSIMKKSFRITVMKQPRLFSNM